jgi:hypothetical protein
MLYLNIHFDGMDGIVVAKKASGGEIYPETIVKFPGKRPE